MENQIIIDKLRTFFCGSETFSAVTFVGFYDMPIDVFLDAEINNCLDSRDDISIRKIFGSNFAHFFNKTLKILEAILIIFKFIHNSNDSSLKSIVAFSIWNRYYFSSTDFSV
jgi:hypothetical protein